MMMSGYHQLAAQRLDYFGDGLKFGLGFSAQRFVETGACDTGKPGDFGHSLGTSCGVKCMDEFISGGICRRFPQEFANIFVGSQVFCNIKFSGSNSHFSVSEHIKNFFGFFNIFALAVFIAARQQQHDLLSTNGVVNANTAIEKTAQFKQVVADGFVIPKVSAFNTIQTGKQFVACCPVKFLEPVIEKFSSDQFVFHAVIVSHGIQYVNRKM